MARDLFCAFQPKRVTVPSLPLRFTWPAIPYGLPPNTFARMVESGIDSIRPAPKVGVGILKMISPEWLAKLGWEMLQPGGVSLRPMIVNRSCTPPSDTKRISRTGPLALIRPSPVSRLTCDEGAAVTCGFELGL